MIDIKQQMMIANGLPENAAIIPTMNNMNGMTNAFLTSNALDKFWLGLRFIRDFAIQNSMMLTRMKSKPYNSSASIENGLFATNVVRYGINEIINSISMFCQIIFESILST
jgi:hypothetical protein